jgi:IS605 OrfB family transposase
MIKATKIEIWKFADGDKERRERWKELSTQVQRMTNRMWQIWLCWHCQNNSADKIRCYLDELQEWRNADKKSRGAKPKLDVNAIPDELNSSKYDGSFYRITAAEFPELHTRTRVLLEKKWKDTLKTRKSAKGSLSGWMAILLANESIPSFTRPMPIPFDKKNSPCDASLRYDDEAKKFFLDVRVERLHRDGGKSVTESCELVLNRRKTRSQQAIVKRIIDGEYTFKGSSLVFDRGKWFVSVSYEMPTKKDVTVNPSKVLYLIPGKKSPWIIKIGNDKWRAFGRGQHVVRMRNTIQNERMTRQEHSRWAGSNAKGHGANRAKSAWTKLSSRWKNFVKNYNHEVTRRVVDRCRQDGIGKVVFCQPRDAKRDLMYLASEGRHPKSRMTWDWFQVGTMLKYKAEQYGIEVETTPGVRVVRKNNRSQCKANIKRKRKILCGV